MTPLRFSRLLLYVLLVGVALNSVVFMSVPNSTNAGLFMIGGVLLGAAASLRGLPLSVIPTSARRAEIRARRVTVLVDFGIVLAALVVATILFYAIESTQRAVDDFWYFSILFTLIVHTLTFWLGLAVSSLILLPIITLIGKLVMPKPAAVVYPPPQPPVAAAQPAPAAEPAEPQG